MIGSKERWYAVARTATTPENMQDSMRIICYLPLMKLLDVADPIMEAILGTLTGSNNKLLLCETDKSKRYILRQPYIGS